MLRFLCSLLLVIAAPTAERPVLDASTAPGAPRALSAPGAPAPSAPRALRAPGALAPSAPRALRAPGALAPSAPRAPRAPGAPAPSAPRAPGAPAPGAPRALRAPGAAARSAPRAPRAPGALAPSAPRAPRAPGALAPSAPRAPRAPGAPGPTTRPVRIVSLIPAVTEILFAVGAGARVVGVSDFDEHPPEVKSITKVGGLLDPNTERILALKPDLVILYNTQDDLREQLSRAGIPFFAYAHAGLTDVFTTIRAIAERVGTEAQGLRLASDMETRLAVIKARVGGRRRPRTMLVFGRQPLALRNINASGGIGFLHDMLEAAGGTNVFADVKRQSLQVSTEIILARAPEVILELRYGEPLTPTQVAGERNSWNVLSAVPAVRDRRVHLLGGDEFVVPGPRLVDATERLARALHPEIF